MSAGGAELSTIQTSSLLILLQVKVWLSWNRAAEGRGGSLKLGRVHFSLHSVVYLFQQLQHYENHPFLQSLSRKHVGFCCKVEQKSTQPATLREGESCRGPGVGSGFHHNLLYDD